VDKWTHIAFSWSGDTDTIKEYVNGQLKQSTSALGSTTVDYYSVTNLIIGSGFAGDVDDLVFYNRVLSDQEIQKRYESLAANTKLLSANIGDDYNYYSNPLANAQIRSGIQSGDMVLIKFDGPTNGPAISVSDGTIGGVDIDSVLSLRSGHSWKNSAGQLNASSTWSSSVYTNDTLIIVLTDVDAQGKPDVAVGDSLVLDGATITDSSTGINDESD